MAGEAGEFHDWELLHNSSESASLNSSNSVASMRDLEEFDTQSHHGMIQTDYFSLDSHNHYLNTTASDQGSVESDNPSWVDPDSETRFAGKEPRELWPDSGSDRSDECKLGEFEGKDEMGFVETGKYLVGIEGIGGIDDKGFAGIGSEEGEGVDVNTHGENDVVSDRDERVSPMEVVKAGGEGEKNSLVWWKVPFELLKFCAFRVSPVWTFSMAAAVMGVVLLTRRLYKMKKKSQALQLKVTMNDKKVSQFMSRAARLNEAFSVVKRVPVIRPALPAAGGLNQWPMMSLR